MAAQPKPPPPKPKRPHVQAAGTQEQFTAAAVELAKKLGWEGQADWVQNDIEVRDAQRFIVKTLHEHFEAGAFGKDQPDYRVACQHLAVDNADERAAIDAALSAAYQAGKGASVTEHPVKKASLDVEMTASASQLLGKLAEHEAKKGQK